MAAAVVILDAVEAPPGAESDHGADTTELLREIAAVSRTLRHPELIREVRARAAAPGETPWRSPSDREDHGTGRNGPRLGILHR
ncbi:hypothetical protein SALBM217S_01684 [Streptomyces griseoloalbus]